MIIGAADGDLGRHTEIESTDYPIVTHRTVSLLQVGCLICIFTDDRDN